MSDDDGQRFIEGLVAAFCFAACLLLLVWWLAT